MGRILRKGLNHWQLLGSLLDLEHTIETCIAHHGNVLDTNLGQQFLAHLVLYKEMGEAIQHRSVLTSIPFEEHLIRTEDAGHAIDGHMTMFQDVQIVVPELVLDEECHHRTNGPQETTGIGNGVERQIGDDICAFVVFAYLIARGREEREQDLILWVIATQLFHQRATLFKLSQRGSMEPYILRIRIDFLPQDAEGLALTTPHLTHLLIEAAVDGHSQEIEVYNQVVNH